MNSPITRRSFLDTSIGVLASLALYGCGASATTQAEDKADKASADAAAEDSITYDDGTSAVITAPINNGYSEGKHHATMEIEGYGTIKLELNATNTPITVSHFAQLVSEGFYDGLTFHRINVNMIQGGDPAEIGTSRLNRTIKGEFFANGVTNAIPHKRGVISMARSSDYDSGSSQFFIMYADAPSYDGRYAAFGKVTEGMDVVDALVANTPVENEMIAADNQPKIVSIRMDD